LRQSPPAWERGFVTTSGSDLAARLLSDVGTRLAHSATVARRSREAAEVLHLHAQRISQLEEAGWLHDIGYAPEAARTGFHSLDGARWLRDHGADDELCSLVAWHTGALSEARFRGIDTDLLAEFPEPPRLCLDVLTWADMTSAPTGEVCTAADRITEILARYHEGSTVHQAVSQSRDDLIAAVARVEGLLSSAA
jgi:hypothetical protein